MIPLASPTLFLYGPPATGKSTCSRNIAVALGKAAIDLDTLIVRRIGCSIPEYVEKHGSTAFRDAETAALKDLCEQRPNAVVALGGGALLRDENRALAEACGPVVCILTPPEILAKRVERKAGSRPFSKNAEGLMKTLRERKDHYNSFTLKLKLERELSPQEVWPRVLSLLGRYIVSGMSAPYTVTVAPDAIDGLQHALARLDPPPRHLLLVGDSNTLPLYKERVFRALGREIPTHTIQAGEEHKTIVEVGRIWESMQRAALERNDLVLALGGGITGDLSGFASATWLRGIRWLNMPTSLLAMVDAGVGGKTGADLPSGKNLIGAFHPPCAVLADTLTLRTLPERELRCGLAETYKHAVIGDPGLADMLTEFERRRDDIDFLTQTVIRSVGVKIRTIQEDPFEKTGKRAALNLGHTVGHAVEAASRFTVAHGEAVAIGTVAAARIAEKTGLAAPGLADTFATALAALGLPTEIPAGYTPDSLRNYLSHDKKKSDGRVRFALPLSMGNVRTGCTVPEEILRAILEGQQG